jgi:hypothetical protein
VKNFGTRYRLPKKTFTVDTILQTIGSLLAGAIAAGLGWSTTEFLARPIRRFYDLRAEIIQKMAEYAKLRARFKQTDNGVEEYTSLSAQESARLEEAQQTFRELGARMRAFAYNETFASRVIGFWYDPQKASQGLIGYSNTIGTYGPDKASKKKMVEDALRLPLHAL